MKAAKRRVIESRLYAIESADWEDRFARLARKVAELEADREMVRRHALGACGAARQALGAVKEERIENHRLQAEINQLRHHKRVLLDYVIKTAVAK